MKTKAAHFSIVVLVSFVAVSASAQSFTSLTSFNSTDGAYPAAGLVQATNGKFYGTTIAGGAYINGTICATGCGTVFEITASGTLTTLYSFDETDGYGPFGLVQARNGKFYGTTCCGGINGSGTVFEITPNGVLTTLYSFCAQTDCTDGDLPFTLVQATDGNFYGTTFYGGAGWGTVFKITPTGTLTTLHSFDGTDGAYPSAGMVQANDGALYGTTSNGGVEDYGTVFKITLGGRLTTLHSFDDSDGSYPQAVLVQATHGSFYGTTSAGGRNSNGMYCPTGCGTVFEITPAGKWTTLYSFCSQTGCTDGAAPSALVQGTDGNLYGTTNSAGAKDYGTVFKITPTGTLTTLHSFDNTDGAYPYAGLAQATNGKFYGTTQRGGSLSDCSGFGCGTVFSLSMGLGPFVETVPTAGRVGAKVTILGNGLANATSVTFNGTAATITDDTDAAIQTTVPAGATTGTVEVTTANGETLKSNLAFRVIP